MATEYMCPIHSCGWVLTDRFQPPADGALAAAFGHGVLAAAARAEHAARLERDLDAHMASHTVTEWALEVSRLNDVLAARTEQL